MKAFLKLFREAGMDRIESSVTTGGDIIATDMTVETLDTVKVCETFGAKGKGVQAYAMKNRDKVANTVHCLYAGDSEQDMEMYMSHKLGFYGGKPVTYVNTNGNIFSHTMMDDYYAPHDDKGITVRGITDVSNYKAIKAAFEKVAELVIGEKIAEYERVTGEDTGKPKLKKMDANKVTASEMCDLGGLHVYGKDG